MIFPTKYPVLVGMMLFKAIFFTCKCLFHRLHSEVGVTSVDDTEKGDLGRAGDVNILTSISDQLQTLLPYLSIGNRLYLKLSLECARFLEPTSCSR